MKDSKMNENMQEQRQAALAILKPSERDLQYGLKLHHESVVIDMYGFGPNASSDTRAIQKAMEKGLSDIEIQDLSESMPMLRHLYNQEELDEYKAAWKASGVTCIGRNAGEESQAPHVLIKRLARFIHVTDVLRDFVPKVVQPDEIAAAHRAGKHCILLTCNGIPLTQDWRFTTTELAWVPLFRQLGCRMMHLTYNRRNMLGDGCAEPANAGLSDFGKLAIAELNRCGIIVDVAHSGWRTSLEAAQASSRPIVASHTTCRTLHDHCRSKPDEVIRAILDSGGMIGICCIAGFLGRTGDINALLDHIDYMLKKFGPDSVGIGTDTSYRSSLNDLQPAINRPKRPGRFESLWPPESYAQPEWDKPLQKMSLQWINWPMFTVGMVQRGHSDETIRKVLGENFLRVLKANFELESHP